MSRRKLKPHNRTDFEPLRKEYIVNRKHAARTAKAFSIAVVSAAVVASSVGVAHADPQTPIPVPAPAQPRPVAAADMPGQSAQATGPAPAPSASQVAQPTP